MWWILAAIILVLAALCLAVSRWAYGVAFGVPKKREQKDIYMLPDDDQYRPGRAHMIELMDALMAVPYERVEITAADGTRLVGRYYAVEGANSLQIQMHGYRGSAIRDFCGGNKLAREMGQSTLLIDQRAHGESEGRTITFGVKEREDCLAWINYARETLCPGLPIFLSGVSMGAATVVMAAGMDLPDEVIGVIADCPYSSPREIIRLVSGRMGYPVDLCWPFIRLGAWIWGGFDPDAASPVGAAANSRVPILLIHGEDDRYVPCSMSMEIADANPLVELHTFPDAGHGLSFITDPERYRALSIEFVTRRLAEYTNKHAE